MSRMESTAGKETEEVPKNVEALIELEEAIRAAQELPVQEPLTGRQECKGYKEKCNNYDSIGPTSWEFGTSQVASRAWRRAG
jgi:hypothetical protein